MQTLGNRGEGVGDGDGGDAGGNASNTCVTEAVSKNQVSLTTTDQGIPWPKTNF